MTDNELLEKNGWSIECESPFEIRHSESNSFATNWAADYVISELRSQVTDALILQSQGGDWEGFFWNGKLIDQAHTLGDGSKTYLLEMSEKYGFNSSDVRVHTVNDEDEDYLADYGEFPTTLNGDY